MHQARIIELDPDAGYLRHQIEDLSLEDERNIAIAGSIAERTRLKAQTFLEGIRLLFDEGICTGVHQHHRRHIGLTELLQTIVDPRPESGYEDAYALRVPFPQHILKRRIADLDISLETITFVDQREIPVNKLRARESSRVRNSFTYHLCLLAIRLAPESQIGECATFELIQVFVQIIFSVSLSPPMT